MALGLYMRPRARYPRAPLSYQRVNESGAAESGGNVLDLNRVSESDGDWLEKTSPVGMGFTGDHTVLAWIKPATFPAAGESRIVNSRWTSAAGTRIWQFALDESALTQELRVALKASVAAGGGTSLYAYPHSLSLNAWEHVGYVCDISEPAASQIEWFVAGASVGNGYVQADGSVTELVNQATAYRIGAQDNTTERPFDGRMDNVYVFNRKLTPAEIASIYQTNLGGPYSGLVAGHEFDDDTWQDISGNGNHMTGAGTPTIVTDDPAF